MKIVNKKKKYVCLISILLIILLSLNTSSAQISADNSKKIEVDVLDRLNNNSEIPVIIKFYEKNDNLVGYVLSDLSISEFKLKRKNLAGNGFAGNITQEGLEKLVDNPNIRTIYLDRISYTVIDKSLPLINATSVWVAGYTGQGQTVCVIDTGINYSHAALGGCFGSGCKVISGYDFVNNDEIPEAQCGEASCSDGIDNDADDKIDEGKHGTNVAGIVAAKGTLNGTAPDARIVAMKACNSDESCSTLNIEDSITWCVNNATKFNISVISISIGNGNSYTEASCPNGARDEINNAYNKNISVIIASGNDGYISGISWPGCRANSTSVGAVYDEDVGREPDAGSWTSPNCFDPNTNADLITCFTNRANNLDLLAPGCRINSTKMTGGFSYMCGTSQATPHVAGAVAILLQADPTLTPDEIKNLLNDTGEQIIDDGTRSRNNGAGSGLTFSRINVYNALYELCPCTSWTSGLCGTGSCSANQRLYTRTCNPSGCGLETNCTEDATCSEEEPPGWTEREVCKSGCTYSTIQSALNSANDGDWITITDNATYNEQIKWPNNLGALLNCKMATLQGTGSGAGIFLNNTNENDIINCKITNYGYGVHNNDSNHIKIKNSTIYGNDWGIYFQNLCSATNYIDGNNISYNNYEGIHFEGLTSNTGTQNTYTQNNVLESNGDYGVYSINGYDNDFINNKISFHDLYGIYFANTGFNTFTEFLNNQIFNNSKGIYLYEADNNVLTGNNFAPGNTNFDIELSGSTGNSGTENTCDKPDGWNDDGFSGCEYNISNTAPIVNLIDPEEAETFEENDITLTCNATDKRELANITLYTNISGTWTANETIYLGQASYEASFTLYNISNGNYKWNCLAYDNESLSDWNDANGTFYIGAYPPLVIDGGSQTLGGNQKYSYVEIKNGGVLYIDSSIGWLNLTASFYINISSNSKIEGSQKSNNTGGSAGSEGNAGYCGANGHGSSGGNGKDFSGSAGGGGYGSPGNAPGAGGGGGSVKLFAPTYNTSRDTMPLPGYGAGGGGGGGGCFDSYTYGGSGGTAGQRGGAGIRLKSPTIKMNGQINSNGGNGGNGGSGCVCSGCGCPMGYSGGGAGSGSGASGGMIILDGNNINISNAKMNSSGGNGGSGGGVSSGCGGGSPGGGDNGLKGAGGRIKIFYTLNLDNLSATFNVGGQSGYNGTVYYNLTNEKPAATLESPSDNNVSEGTLTFSCSATDDYGLANITLYTNISGTWQANETKTLSGTSDNEEFSLYDIPIGHYVWNCITYDSAGLNDFADSNRSFDVVDSTAPAINIILPENTTYSYKTDLALNYTLFDKSAIDSCWYKIDNGSNTSLTNCQNTTFNISDDGSHNATVYANDSYGNKGSSIEYFTIETIIEYGQHNFIIQNSSGSNVSIFSDNGNIVLKGQCSVTICDNPPADSFVLRNSTNDIIAYAGSDGNLCIEYGTCADNSASCSPVTDAFIVKDENSTIVSYIDVLGDLCLTGNLYQNAL